MGKFYAVKNGYHIGIYNSWADCEKEVRGFSGAKYKSFSRLEDAKEYLGEDALNSHSYALFAPLAPDAPPSAPPDTSAPVSQAAPLAPPSAPPDTSAPVSQDVPAAPAAAVAYVDGSYNAETNVFGCGVVIFQNGSASTFSRCFHDPEMALMRNVAGEIEGAMLAMRFCLDHDIEEIDIYYDYEGIEKWCSGAWKTNKKGTTAYKHFYDSIKHRVKVNFIKVKGHSGDKYNDMADKLAKDAVGIN